MTQEEFTSFIEEQKQAGMSEEDISVVFCQMFKDGKLNREQLEACLAVLGYEMSEELKAMPDEELKEKILVEGKGEEGDDKEVEGGKEPPAAPKEPEEKPDEKPSEPKPEEPKPEEPKPEEKEEEIDEEQEAMKLFGIKK